MAKTHVYVDGFNLYHSMAATGVPHIKWLDLNALAMSLLNKTDTLVAVNFFTAEHTRDPGKLSRHRRYMDALRSVGVNIILSRFQRTDKACQKTGNNCYFYEEKETDVVFALTAFNDARGGNMERAIFITADSDQVPTIKMIRENFPNICVDVWLPPGRDAVGRTLAAAATNKFILTIERLATCLLPVSIYKAGGGIVATCPAEYEHPDRLAR